MALVVRLILAGVVAVHHGGHLFLDDQTYHAMARERADGSDGAWDPYTSWLYERTATYLVPVTVLYRLFGSHVLLGQLVSVAFGTAAVAGVAFLGARVVGPRCGLLAGLLLALLPSQVLWSSLTLKDAAVWAMAVGTALAVRTTNRADSVRALAVGLGTLVVLSLLLGHLRSHTLVVSLWVLVLALVAGERRFREVRVASGVLLALLLPLLVGLSVGGASLLRDLDDLPELRANNATGARSQVTGPSEPPAEPGASSEPAPVDDGFLGEVVTNLRHLPSGLVVVSLRPFPWESGGGRAFTAARWETILWYPLLLLAVAGLRVAVTFHRDLLYPLLFGLGILFVYALGEGNVGTAFRHRGELTWVVLLFAAIQLDVLLTGRSSRAGRPGRAAVAGR